ncbi:hypothetical protein KEM48_006218 [Puccinia striiformis f. sp. tritici PST-130]|nr:hypothetical protein KEM48_006218 [Puccinia striiformis f. sp. tritici PST-130]
MSKLRLRGLLTDTFFWLPGRVTLAAILLICSIRKQRKSIGRLEEIMRREHISLAIKILDDLAPSTYAATVHSKTIRILFGLLDVENPSLLESLASQTTEEINSPLLPTTGRHQSSDKSMPGNGSVLGGRCVASCSSSGEDPSPPAPAPPSGWDPIELTAFAYADPAGTTNQAFPFARLSIHNVQGKQISRRWETPSRSIPQRKARGRGDVQGDEQVYHNPKSQVRLQQPLIDRLFEVSDDHPSASRQAILDSSIQQKLKADRERLQKLGDEVDSKVREAFRKQSSSQQTKDDHKSNSSAQLDGRESPA